jgi:hypothetical protein
MKEREFGFGWRWDLKSRARMFWLFGLSDAERLNIEKRLQLAEEFGRLRAADAARAA